MLGDKLRRLRREKNLTQKELADLFCVSQSSIGLIETGQRNVTDELKLKYASFFGKSVEEIFFN